MFVDETRNAWGKGEVIDIGFMPGDALVEKIVARGVERAGVTPGVRFPIVVRSGRLKNGHIVRYIPNCSATEQKPANPGAGIDLLHDRRLLQSERVTLEP